MTKENFLAKLKALSGNDLVNFINQFAKPATDIDTYLKEYDPEKHDIFDKTLRPDKWIQKPIEGLENEDGTPKTYGVSQPVSRISIDAQQHIAKSAAGILCANKIRLMGSANTIQQVWDKNKLDLKTITACTAWLSETEIADLWYYKGKDLKVMFLSNGNGDTMYPVFDDLGDMICFGRSYKSQDIIEGQLDLKPVTYYEIYLDDVVVKGNDSGEGLYEFASPVSHKFKQIPVSYCSIKRPIYWNVRTPISRFETSISNLCDTNDYFGSPTAVVKGKILSFASKGESGKILELDPEDTGAEIKYLTWDQAPESIKLEWEKLWQIIRESTRTVNLSVENLKGLFGSAPSSYAIKLLFTPAHLQAAEHEEIFGEYIQRRINIIAEQVGGDAQPQFDYYLPKNESEDVTNVNAMVAAGTLSVESAVEANVLGINADDEVNRVEGEKEPVPLPVEPAHRQRV